MRGSPKLAPGGNGVTGTKGGIPFPTPKDGLEAIWNSTLRYRGDTYAMKWGQAAVTREGTYTMVSFDYEYDFNYGNLSKPAKDREDNKLAYFLQTVTGPARLAGQILLVDETVDQVKEPRSAWTYNPGQRRVRLAPQVAYDNPGTASDGLRTSDDFQMYNGATDRYNWKLVGKQEMYIPYNSYKISGNEVKVADVLKPGHVNPDLARYELHRVWVVEATLKEGTNHIYKKRVFYIDEDSWSIAVTDKYDTRMRAVARVRAAFDQLLRHTDALRNGRGAPRPAVGALSGDGPAQRRAQGVREDQARQGGFHAGRPARNRHALSGAPTAVAAASARSGSATASRRDPRAIDRRAAAASGMRRLDRMNKLVGLACFLVVLGAAAFAFSPRPVPAFPATAVSASRLLLLGVAAADKRAVAVGERGVIVLSDDDGRNWRVAKSPTEATLTAVYFVDAQRGFAVGHDAVILMTEDAGETWTQVHAAPDEQKPLLAVWFENAERGIAVGAYSSFYRDHRRRQELAGDGGVRRRPAFQRARGRRRRQALSRRRVRPDRPFRRCRPQLDDADHAVQGLVLRHPAGGGKRPGSPSACAATSSGRTTTATAGTW